MTDFVYELAGTGTPDRATAARAWADEAARRWRGLSELAALDLYTPVGGAHDPFNDDGAGPLFIAMLAFPSRESLAGALSGLRLDGLPAGCVVTGSSFERQFYPVAGETKPAPLTAPFSYVVRYHKPAEDEAAFIRNYVATHPPTLGELPGIRAVMCYFPLPLAAPGIAPADYMVGNEVVFDTIESFNAAMQSPVRQELRRHFREFPPFTGRNTHFPMNRARLAG